VRRLLLALAVLSSVAMSSCTKVDQSKARVLEAIDRTEQQAREFSYTEKASGSTTVVKGVIEDDLRYSLTASVDGSPAASEVVVDDARALQVSNAAVLQKITASGQGSRGTTPVVSASPSPSASPSIDPSSPLAPAATATIAGPVPDDLTAGRWVVDKKGAIGLVAGTSGDALVVGRNPLLDSITALEYTRRAINEATDIARFNPESSDYRPKLDPFPRPAAGTLRYDVVPPILTPRSNGTGGAVRVDPPATPFFRLLAVYVRDGRVAEVRLRDPQSNLDARLGDFVKVSPGATVSDKAAALLKILNRQLAQTAKPLIRPREMALKFTSLGHSATVRLPPDATAGDLSGAGAHGQLLYQQR